MTNASHSMEFLNFELGNHFPNPTLQNGLGEAICQEFSVLES